MDYVPPLFRPPSESASLLLQVTIGCSHNKCTYCAMYREKTFRIKPWDVIEADIEEGTRFRLRRVFLCDGDALMAPQDLLEQTLEAVRERMPWVERVGTYGDARSILRKTPEELRRLRDRGLGIIYHGLETGDEEILKEIKKGSTVEDAARAGERVRESGIIYSAMVMLGLGGVKRSEAHARATAELINRVQPTYLGVLTTMLEEDTPLAEQVASGAFELPSRFAMLRELRILMEDLKMESCLVTSNHASNHLSIRAVLPQDKQKILAYIDKVLETRKEELLRPDFLRNL